MILAARALLLDASTWIEGGALVVERGRVRAVLHSRRALLRRRGRARDVHDLGELVLSPGLVDAHAHLELGALAGRIAEHASFGAWIGAVVRARARLARSDLGRGVRTGAHALLASGTTAVGDIDSTGTSARVGARLGVRLVVYRELLDAWDPARTAAALRLASVARRARALVRAGLSPHAPYTTSRALLAGVGVLVARRPAALAIHWAETPEEGEWLVAGRGPLAGLLPTSPRRSGLALLDEAGLLGPRTALVHGNHPRAGELELLARRGVTLVHCPGTHAWFERAPFPLRRYRAAGIPLALGTDSLASNEELDMRREMALFRASHPTLAPAEVFAMATEGGARALGFADAGHARPGAVADLVAWRLAARTRAAALAELTGARPAVERILVAGRPVHVLGRSSPAAAVH